ncbi:MAG: OmpA family protein [Polyangiaceae bacterium]
MKKTFGWMMLTTAMLASTACGHTDEEMEAKQREIDKISAELKAAKTQLAQDQSRYTEAQAELDRMRDQLKAAGAGEAKLQQALSEYRARAEQLAIIEGRFKELRSKLEKLSKIGLKVVVRNNRMVIQLPGDILFDSGKDELREQGKEALSQVAEIVRNDKDLNSRNFQVAGHTDNAKYGGGPFHDNWGLSLARARQVLLYLISPATPDKKGKVNGGGLNAKHWAASGYGETDPIAGTVESQAKDDMQKNRRVELIVQPNVEEMLNLNNIK